MKELFKTINSGSSGTGRLIRRMAAVVALLLTVLLITGCAGASDKKTSDQSDRAQTRVQSDAGADKDQEKGKQPEIREDEEYSSKEDVALYLSLYEHLPDNYITKSEAKKLGWVSSEGNLWDVAPGKSIGGDTYGNREGILPEKKSRKYYECDVNYTGGFRTSERIVYSNDGLIYYTEDHYNSFEQLYGEEN